MQLLPFFSDLNKMAGKKRQACDKQNNIEQSGALTKDIRKQNVYMNNCPDRRCRPLLCTGTNISNKVCSSDPMIN